MSPKKHMVICLEKKEQKGSSGIPVFTMDVVNKAEDSAENRMMVVKEEEISVSEEYLQTGTMTIVDARNYYSKDMVRTRNKPKVHSFSEEIKLYYKFVTRNGVTSAIASYRSYPDANGKSHNILTKEKGLRYKSVDELPQRLNNLLFEDQISKEVVRDISKAFKDRKIELSIKSLWYIHRTMLMKDDDYDDNLCREIFSSDFQIGDMKCDEMYRGEALRSINDSIGSESVSAKKKYILQFQKMFELFCREGIAFFNPFNELLKEYSNRMEAEQYEVRNALTKKNLTIGEQISVLQYFAKGTVWQDSKKLEVLIIAFRLLTPIPIREMLALNWGDMQENKDYHFFQIKVTKLIERDGKHVVYGTKKDWKRFRKIPLVYELARMLNARKSFLKSTYHLTDKQIDEYPMFGEQYATKNPKRYRYEQINKICREATASLNTPELKVALPGEKELITDLNRYYSDLFLSNFRYHTNHTCYMTHGEINYIFGRVADDTFSAHYCDYTNDGIQYAVYRKLNRWATLLHERISGFDMADDEYSERFVKHHEYNLPIVNSGEISINISNPMGVNIRIQTRKGESNG